MLKLCTFPPEDLLLFFIGLLNSKCKPNCCNLNKKYEGKKQELEEERDRWDEQVKKLRQNSDEYLLEAEVSFDFVEGITERFQKGALKEKKFILSEIGSNFVIKNGKLALTVDAGYQKIKELREVIPSGFELEETPSVSGLNEAQKGACPCWRRRGVTIRTFSSTSESVSNVQG